MGLIDWNFHRVEKMCNIAPTSFLLTLSMNSSKRFSMYVKPSLGSCSTKSEHRAFKGSHNANFHRMPMHTGCLGPAWALLGGSCVLSWRTSNARESLCELPGAAPVAIQHITFLFLFLPCPDSLESLISLAVCSQSPFWDASPGLSLHF